jgi:polar amino acid transport system permease protein
VDILSFVLDRAIPVLNQGFAVSTALIVPSAALGLLLGIVVGTLRTHGPRTVRAAANAYVAVFRGTPLFLQLFYIYYALPKIGLSFEPYYAAVLGFVLCSGAYHSEYIRGSLLATRQGQYRAAHALGFSTFKTLVWIVVPQAVRRALPGCSNEIIYLIKYTSLASLITNMDLTKQAKMVASETFMVVPAYVTVAFYYLAMVTIASFLLKRLERHLRVPGFTGS